MDRAKIGTLLSMLHEGGHKWADIAEELDMTPETLRAFRDKLGMERRHNSRLTPDTLAKVKRMRADGKTWAAIECATGHNAQYLCEVIRAERNKK